MQPLYAAAVAANANSTGLVAFFALLKGDVVDSVRVLIRTSAAHADIMNGDDFTLEIYVCNSKPASVAEARNGRALLAATDFPLQAEPDSSLMAAVGHFRESLPMIHQGQIGELYVALVFTAPTNVALTGAALLDVYRPGLRE
jgi:hypothetical protein